MSQGQIINSLLNLNQLFSALYDLKFKGRKNIEDILNTMYEHQLLVKHSKNNRNSVVFETAISNCWQTIGGLLAKFQSQLYEPYLAHLEKVKLNWKYIEAAAGKNGLKSPFSAYEFLLLQLMQLSLDLSQSYQNQADLIDSHWKMISQHIFVSEGQSEQLKELMLHIGFQTYIDDAQQEAWRIKMAALSNQRYNPKKN